MRFPHTQESSYKKPVRIKYIARKTSTHIECFSYKIGIDHVYITIIMKHIQFMIINKTWLQFVVNQPKRNPCSSLRIIWLTADLIKWRVKE